MLRRHLTKVSPLGIEFLSIEARVVMASVETYLKYTEDIGLTATAGAALAWTLGRLAPQGRIREQMQETVNMKRDILISDPPGERRLGGVNEQYRLFIESVQDYAIILLDPEGMVTTWNVGGERILGYRRAEIVGQPAARFFTPEDIQKGQPEQELATAKVQGQVSSDRWQVRKDCTRFWSRGLTTALRDESGRVRGFAKVMRDLTERKFGEEQIRQRNEELAEASQQKDAYLAMLAHELRNPLAALCNGLHILSLPHADLHFVEQTRTMMERQLGHLTQMLDDLLDVSRIAWGHVVLRSERLDLSPLLRTITQDHRPAFERAGLTLAIELPELPLWVKGDRLRLTQVIDNLVQNAVKFTDRGGTVAVRLAAEEDRHQAVLTVRDNGVGIEAKMLPLLFEPLAQADRTLDRSKGGLGLGMALVKGLVELHDGAILAASAGLGRGAEFTVRLPLEPEPPALSNTDAKPRRPSRRLRILIVEDNRDAANSLRMLLELYGHDVEVTYAGPDGVRQAKDWHPEVILCDIGLPGMDGYAVVGELRRDPETARTVMVAITGYGQEEDRRRSFLAGFDLHLTKPVDCEVLQSVLEEADRRIERGVPLPLAPVLDDEVR